MTVYIEYVLLDNFIVDYLILKTTHNLLKKSYKKLRLALSSLLGAIFALLFPLFSLGTLLELFVKLLTGVIVVLLSNKYSSTKDGFISVLTFILITFIFGGGVYAIFGLIGLKLGTKISIALIILPVYATYKILLLIISQIFKIKEISRFTYQILIKYKNKEIIENGFLDTGNLTFIENKPAVFVSSHLAQQIFGVKDYLRLKKIKITTVNGIEEKYCAKIDEFSVYVDNKWNIYTNVWCVIVSPSALGSVKALFGSAFLEGENVKTTA